MPDEARATNWAPPVMGDDGAPPGCVSCQQSAAPAEQERAKRNLAGGAVTRADCQAKYDVVEKCMREKRNAVRECVREWDAFRECHNQS